ncbi:beta-ketoacyl-ACP synthase II [bacterium]|nr:beta-ketoacyl-ACP synthase II [bacterium]
MQKRVAVTGLGCVTAFGIGKKILFDNLRAGNSAVSLISSFDTSDFKTKIAAEIKDFDASLYFPKNETRKMDRFTQFAAVAAKDALLDSEIDLEKLDKSRFGVVLGVGFGGISTILEQHKILLERGPRRVSPFGVPMCIPNMAAGNLSILFGAKGVCETVSTACASASHAIAAAARLIQRGNADIIICGGSEAPINPLVLAAFSSMQALSKRNDDPEKASRPFDKERDGFVLGEGSGIVILESFEHALSRNARIYAEVSGVGSSADAYHITSPDPEAKGAESAMRSALLDAGTVASEVDLVVAHGTGTLANDPIETKAIKAVFGEKAYKTPVISIKSMLGHTLGAAAALEAVAAVSAMLEGVIPPTINLDLPDPECDLDYVPNVARKAEIKCVMTDSFGFGGQNSVLIFKSVNN